MAHPRDLVWDVLTDPATVARLTPMVRSITAKGDLWHWQLVKIPVLGQSFELGFTEAMTYDPKSSDHLRPRTSGPRQAGARRDRRALRPQRRRRQGLDPPADRAERDGGPALPAAREAGHPGHDAGRPRRDGLGLRPVDREGTQDSSSATSVTTIAARTLRPAAGRGRARRRSARGTTSRTSRRWPASPGPPRQRHDQLARGRHTGERPGDTRHARRTVAAPRVRCARGACVLPVSSTVTMSSSSPSGAIHTGRRDGNSVAAERCQLDVLLLTEQPRCVIHALGMPSAQVWMRSRQLSGTRPCGPGAGWSSGCAEGSARAGPRPISSVA